MVDGGKDKSNKNGKAMDESETVRKLFIFCSCFVVVI